MKTALVIFNNEKIYSNEYLSIVLNSFNMGGIKLDTIDILSPNDEIGFNNRLAEFKDTKDLLVVLSNSEVDLIIKEAIPQVLDSDFSEDNLCIIPNLIGEYKGFVLEKDNFTLITLSNVLNEFKQMFDSYALPFLEKKLDIKRKKLTLKYFGEKQKLLSVLENTKEKLNISFLYNLQEKYGDFTVKLLFDENELEDKIREVIRIIVGELKENIYAEFDCTLGERLIDVLKLYNLRISIAESFTAGRITAELIKTSGASQYVHEGIVAYSNKSKSDRLCVNKDDLIKEGAVSSIVAYEMAVGLLKTNDCDIAISTTGIAGPKSDNTNKPVGLCYIAVGTLEGVHTYKFNLTGSREEITETAKNNALFLAIKNIKGKR